MSDPTRKILYCRCAFAQVVPETTKNGVLENLCESGVSFDSVSDLCEMAARRDSRLSQIMDAEGDLVIAACYPRAVKWLFHHAGAPFPEDPAEKEVTVLNMRESSAEEITRDILE